MNEPNSRQLSGLRILIVDDEPIIRESIALTLEDVGAETALAASVNEALACIDSFHPDVLLSDINMPEADGFTLIRAIQAKMTQSEPAKQGIVAIAMTASASTEEQQRALSAGFVDYLPKPFGQAQLIEAIRRGRGSRRVGE